MTNPEAPPLFNAPPVFSLPLVKGQDLIVNFKNRVPDSNPVEYEAYEAGVVVTLIIDTAPPTEAVGVVDGVNAVCRLESTVTDTIKGGLLWRARVTLPGSPTTDLVAITGKTVRPDGSKP
jgi:hypothetical protein